MGNGLQEDWALPGRSDGFRLCLIGRRCYLKGLLAFSG